ncbi:hypothetical protein GGS26DRAFT_587526 [Hypomontagnella submonticulosa]|nr:hypothetical protein GGS26DRAFT_587526 [Hypomontagnella submonticulosa]
MALTLEGLPIIVLERICELMAQDDPTLRTVQAFALANKHCCSVAQKQRFSQIHLVLRNSGEVHNKMVRLNELLSVGGRLHYVRRLKVTRASREDIEWERSGLEYSHDRGRRYLDFDMHPFCQPTDGEHWNTSSIKGCSIKRMEDVAAFANFIRRLSHLEDLVWADMIHMPRPILSAIHSIGCRLHMHALKLDCLVPSAEQPGFTDPDQFALVTSPSFYSIVALCRNQDFEDPLGPIHTRANQEAVFRMVAGAAPNLAHVQLVDCDWKDSDATSIVARPKFLPPALVGGETKSGRLRSLALHMTSREGLTGWITKYSQIRSLESYANFSELRSLAIDMEKDDDPVLSEEVLPYLAKLAMDGNFESLRALALSLHFPENGGDRMQAAMVLLLEHLNPLESLDLHGFVSKRTYETAVRCHGATLRNLRVRPRRSDWEWRHPGPRIAFTEAVVRRLVEKCPKLKRLELPIDRKLGNAHETGIYRALSRLSRLAHVRLVLEVSIETIPGEDEEIPDPYDGTTTGPHINANNNDIPSDRIRDALINAAVDASLARSIFNMMSPDGQLNYLELRYMDRWDHPPNYADLGYLLMWVGQSWSIERDCRGEISVRRLVNCWRDWIEEQVKDMTGYEAVWESLWPPSGENWWQDWRSFPLSQD